MILYTRSHLRVTVSSRPGQWSSFEYCRSSSYFTVPGSWAGTSQSAWAKPRTSISRSISTSTVYCTVKITWFLWQHWYTGDPWSGLTSRCKQDIGETDWSSWTNWIFSGHYQSGFICFLWNNRLAVLRIFENPQFSLFLATALPYTLLPHDWPSSRRLWATKWVVGSPRLF